MKKYSANTHAKHEANPKLTQKTQTRNHTGTKQPWTQRTQSHNTRTRMQAKTWPWGSQILPLIPREPSSPSNWVGNYDWNNSDRHASWLGNTDMFMSSLNCLRSRRSIYQTDAYDFRACVFSMFMLHRSFALQEQHVSLERPHREHHTESFRWTPQQPNRTNNPKVPTALAQ